MNRVQLDWGWRFAALMFVLAALVAGFSFDMIAHWNNKRREDLRIMLLVLGCFGIAVLFFTVDLKLLVFNSILIAVLVISGWLASEENFAEKGTSKPWELYFIAILSLVALVGSVVWAYFYSKTGKYIRKKGKQAKDKYTELRQNRQERQQEKREMAEQRLRQKSKDQFTNPIFDEDTDYASNISKPVPALRRRKPQQEALYDTTTTGTESD